MTDPCVCFHEAGHAVAARLLGFPAGRCVVYDDGTGYATVYYPKRGCPIPAKIMVCLSGSEAEHRFFGEYGHDSIDRQQALELARDNGLDADDVAELRRLTRAVIDQNWSAVRAVALALKRQGHMLTGRQIDALFATKLAMMEEEEI